MELHEKSWNFMNIMKIHENHEISWKSTKIAYIPLPLATLPSPSQNHWFRLGIWGPRGAAGMEFRGFPWKFVKLHDVSWCFVEFHEIPWNFMISSQFQCFHRNERFGWISLANTIWITTVSAKGENRLDGAGVWWACLFIAQKARSGTEFRENHVKSTGFHDFRAARGTPSEYQGNDRLHSLLGSLQFRRNAVFHEISINLIKKWKC